MNSTEITNAITIKIVFSALGGFLANMIGGYDALMISLVTLMILDYITGLLSAAMKNELSSSIGFRGIIKKFMIIIIICVTVQIQHLISQNIALRETVIIFFISNESISILENIEAYVPLPTKLVKMLKQINKENNKK